jgi:large repetitive protein
LGTEMNLSGTVTITGNTLTNALYHGVDIVNHNGTISSANISGNTITSSTSNVASNGSGIRIQQLGSISTVSHVTNMSIANNVITNFPDGAGIVVHGGNAAAGGPAGQMGQAGNAGAIVNITGNTIAGASGANRMGVNAIQAAVSGIGQGNFNISGNGTVGSPLTNITGNVIVLSSLGTATVTSTIANNVIVANQPNNGGFGISVGSGEVFGVGNTSTVSALIQNNNISQTDGNGIIATAKEGNSGLVARILNNTVAAPLNGVRPGIRVDAGAPTIGQNNTVCLEISGNTSAGSGGTNGIGLRRESTGTNVFGVEGMAATSSPGVETYINGQNPAGNGTLLISATTGFSSCTAP